MLTNKLKEEIASLPGESLKEIEMLIKKLKTQTPIDRLGSTPYNVFDEIAEGATDIGIRDLSRNHDLYLYGAGKR